MHLSEREAFGNVLSTSLRDPSWWEAKGIGFSCANVNAYSSFCVALRRGEGEGVLGKLSFIEDMLKHPSLELACER